MSLRSLLRESFSPYEIAIMGRVITIALAACSMAAWFPHPTRVTSFAFGIGALLFLIALATAFVWDEFSSCPTCQKSPTRLAKGDMNWFQRVASNRELLWPETQCSECGTALDIRP